MFAVTSFLSDEGAGAEAVGAAAANDAARYHLGLQSTSGDKRDKKSHKIGTKRRAGRPCQQSRGALLSHESQLKELKCTEDGRFRRVLVLTRGRMAARGHGAARKGLGLRRGEGGQDDDGRQLRHDHDGGGTGTVDVRPLSRRGEL